MIVKKKRMFFCTKDTGSVNINSIQDGDSKSSAQNNRPFEPLDFQLNPAGNTVGVGGNYNRFGSGTFGYQNVRQQSYYGDSPGNGGGGGGGGQRNNFYNNFNDIGGSYPGGNGGGGGGSPYQYANLNYNGAGYAGAGGYAGGYGFVARFYHFRNTSGCFVIKIDRSIYV